MQRVLARIEERGVRVEHAEHAGNRAVIKGAVGIDGDGVVLLNEREHAGEILDVVLQIGGVGGCGAERGAVQNAKHRREREDREN